MVWNRKFTTTSSTVVESNIRGIYLWEQAVDDVERRSKTGRESFREIDQIGSF